MEHCYVCGTEVPPPKQIITFEDGSVDDGSDENGHFLCRSCDESAWAIWHTVAEWRSSEDRDIWVLNAAVEGLRVGRTLSKPQSQEEPMSPCV